MTIHKEGYPSIAFALIVSALLLTITHWWLDAMVWRIIAYSLSAFLLIMMLQFFRSPKRNTPTNENHVIAPADGKVVVIEEVEETEYFKDKRIQLSVFMSPVNVHVNRYPSAGTIKYVKYHPGKYLVAWHPKSSTENERTTIVTEDQKGRSVLIRQIAGALARRIVYYSKVNEAVEQGSECGFIKFGSRVDILLPLGTDIKVQLGDKVRGGESVLAQFTS
jgi:phosphatidylserine decarboxylase